MSSVVPSPAFHMSSIGTLLYHDLRRKEYLLTLKSIPDGETISTQVAHWEVFLPDAFLQLPQSSRRGGAEEEVHRKGIRWMALAPDSVAQSWTSYLTFLGTSFLPCVTVIKMPAS